METDNLKAFEDISAISRMPVKNSTSIPHMRFLDSWEEDPLADFRISAHPTGDYLTRFYQLKDVEAIDEICKSICHLPTMKAMTETYPEVKLMPIVAWRPGPSVTSLGEYHPTISQIWLNVRAKNIRDTVSMGASTIPHEERHGVQDIEGCLYFKPGSLLSQDNECKLALQRVKEGDATVFSIAVAYECFLFNADIKPLQQIMEIRPTSTQAYLNEIAKDEKSHWDGRAANSALKAYMRKGNRSVLEIYETKLCEGFMHADARPILRSKDYRIIINKGFAEFIAPMRRMPFIDQNGHMEERPCYWNGIDFDPSKLVQGLSVRANYSMVHAHLRDMSIS